MVLEDQIKWYLPLHELDELKPTQPALRVNLSADDLFLISKLSAYSTETENAVTVSKKLSYKNLNEKISDDFGIYDMKIDIEKLSIDLSGLSGELCATSSYLSSSIRKLSTELSGAIDKLSTNVYTTINNTSSFLSTSIRNLSTGLSGAIDKLSGELCATSSYLSTSIRNLSTGLSNTIKTLSTGLSNTIKTLSTGLSNTIKTLSTGLSGAIDKLSGELYSTSSFLSTAIDNLCSNIMVRSDLSNYVKKLETPLDENVVNGLNLYKISIDISCGTILSAEKCEIDSIGTRETRERSDIGYEYGLSADNDNKGYVYVPYATSTSAGVVKLGGVDNLRNYPLRLSTDHTAYISVNTASNERAGVIGLGNNDNGLSHRVFLNANNEAYVSVDLATTDRAGVIKVGTNSYSGSSFSTYNLLKSSDGETGVIAIPYASSNYGVIKAKSEAAAGSGTSTAAVYIQNGGSDTGYAFVKYNSGLTSLGNPSSEGYLTDNMSVLVNLTNNNTEIQNYIKGSNIKGTVFNWIKNDLSAEIANQIANQIMSEMNIVPKELTRTALCAYQPVQYDSASTDNPYQQCKCITTEAGWYLFDAVLSTSENPEYQRIDEDRDLWCEVILNDNKYITVNTTCFSYIKYIPANVKVVLEAWCEARNKTSGQRKIFRLTR